MNPQSTRQQLFWSSLRKYSFIREVVNCKNVFWIHEYDFDKYGKLYLGPMHAIVIVLQAHKFVEYYLNMYSSPKISLSWTQSCIFLNI